MSFLRMQESPSSIKQELPAFAGMTEKDSFHTVSFVGITGLNTYPCGFEDRLCENAKCLPTSQNKSSSFYEGKQFV
ncbi:MAG: hypothetical protein NT007_07760 [Candidatus Kapabacteria bacterium]|nr:hypothetical protein [Candidatus Kapabacteria bacterium]